ncbi:hypothetical protein [Paludisphaera borealis]|uniref:Uncharacterized protein n=1 Tax=Paludisphaera borealis TaxID=1387353 RepID=A0A1U7CRC6_9BACT|nr:hypothetical protein [Paludisphaera borealis]APW61449.1 hypothetical protein BSF38_02963 [Paludisphaera borealis]
MPTPSRRDYTLWVQIALVVLGVSVSGLIVAQRLRAQRASSAPVSAPVEPPSPAPPLGAARQVTVFAIRAVPGESAIDPRLSSVKAQLRKVLPDHGFELLEVQTGRLDPGEFLKCDLGRGWLAKTTLEPPSADDFGRVRLRCELIDGDKPRFSTLVDAPENQLFFYERALRDGMHVLIGVGAR